jgi:multiple sugar transport system substrate-binding protein
MKKIVSLALALLLVFALAACGNNAAPPASGGDAPAPTPAPDASGDKIQLTFSFWGGESELEATTAMLDLYNSQQDKVEVVPMQIPWETYIEQLNVMATGNELPDAGMINEAGTIAWAEQGMLLDVSDMYGTGEAAPLDSLRFTYQGKTVAYSVCSNILALWYNTDMFDAAGVDYPPITADKAWTWDEFVEVAKKLTLDANGKTPNDAGFDKNNIVQYGCMIENLTWQLEQWALSNGGGFFNADGTEVTITDPATIEAIQAVADLYLVHNVAPLSTGLTDDGVQRSLLAGTCAMTTNGTWAIGAFLAGPRDAGEINYGMGVMPYMKEKVALSTAGPAVVFSQTKHPEEAMEFIKWYTNPENNWGLFGLGIWCPPLESYYTDPALMDKWLGGPNFPPREMSEAILVDYQMKYAKSAAWYYTNNCLDFNDLLGSVLGDVWTGAKTAEQAITEAEDNLKAAHAGF